VPGVRKSINPLPPIKRQSVGQLPGYGGLIREVGVRGRGLGVG